MTPEEIDGYIARVEARCREDRVDLTSAEVINLWSAIDRYHARLEALCREASADLSSVEVINLWLMEWSPLLVAELGPKLTCGEASSLAAVFSAHGRVDLAWMLNATHALNDVEGDQHHIEPDRRDAILEEINDRINKW